MTIQNILTIQTIQTILTICDNSTNRQNCKIMVEWIIIHRICIIITNYSENQIFRNRYNLINVENPMILEYALYAFMQKM